MTEKQSGHTPAGMDRLTKNLTRKCNRYAANLQWLFGFCLTDSNAILAGATALIEVL